MAQMPAYRSRYGDTITDLLSRRGDIAAAGALRSGDIWGSTVGNLGAIAGQAVQGYAQVQQEKKRGQLFTDALQTWDANDLVGFTKRMASVIGPEDAMKFSTSMMAFENIVKKNQQGEVPTLEELKAGIVGAHILTKNAPEEFKKQYPMLREQFGPAIKIRLGYELPEEPTAEVEQGLRALAEQWGGGKPQGEVIETIGPDGKPVKRRVSESELAIGVPVYKVPEKPEPPPVPSFQAKEVLNDDGKPVMANFDARTGRYVDPSTNRPIKNPRPVPSAAETQDSRKFQQAGPILKSVSELSERINTLQGVYASAAGATAKAKAKINLDDDVAEYEALISGFTPLVARALGHTGVLTQQDVDSVKALFPRPEDSKSLRDRKVKRIKTIIGELEGGASPTGNSQATVGRFKVEVE